MSLGNLLSYTRKLNNIGRWANEFLHRRQSVAEHSFSVAQIAQMLGILEEQAGGVIDWKRLYRKSLNHDLAEALVGDVISTTKNYSPEAKAALEVVERELVHRNLLSPLPDGVREEYTRIMHDGKDDTTEGMILRAADDIDALIECIQEVRLANNDPFLDKYFMILGKIRKSPLSSVAVFLESILPALVQDTPSLMTKQGGTHG